MTDQILLGCFASAPLSGKVKFCGGCDLLDECLNYSYDNLIKIRHSVPIESEIRRHQLIRAEMGWSMRVSCADVGSKIPLTDQQVKHIENAPREVAEIYSALWVRGMDARIMRSHLREQMNPMEGVSNRLPKSLHMVNDILMDVVHKGSVSIESISSSKPIAARERFAKIALVNLHVLRVINKELVPC